MNFRGGLYQGDVCFGVIFFLIFSKDFDIVDGGVTSTEKVIITSGRAIRTDSANVGMSEIRSNSIHVIVDAKVITTAKSGSITRIIVEVI